MVAVRACDILAACGLAGAVEAAVTAVAAGAVEAAVTAMATVGLMAPFVGAAVGERASGAARVARCRCMEPSPQPSRGEEHTCCQHKTYYQLLAHNADVLLPQLMAQTCLSSRVLVSLAVGAFALEVVEDYLAHAHGLGCHLHILVFLDIFQRLFK